MTAPPMTLAGPAAASPLAALHGRCFDEVWDEHAFRAILSSPGAFAVVDDARDPRAFVLCRVIADEAEILTMGTLPNARRRGAGRAILTEALSRLQKQGVARVHLEVAEDNAPARALYAALGFSQTGRRKGYYAVPGRPAVDALALTVGLSGSDEGRFAAALRIRV
ncbi:MAG: GNAT family N-acetyltransferase [Alphaproteobacteria bacterium]